MILVIEDDVSVAGLVKLALGYAGHRIQIAHRCDTARRTLARRTVDLVIADVHLPDGSGRDVADEAACMGIPTLLVTGYPDDMQDPEFLCGVALAKPFRLAELQRRVDRLLGVRPGQA